MKTFEDYKDGEWVVYKNPGHNWNLMQFQAYKSHYTFNAFRLKYGSREVIADISEIEPISEATRLAKEEYEKSHRDLQRGFEPGTPEEEEDFYSEFQD